MGRPSNFTPDEQRLVKADIWNGMTNAEVSNKWGISSPSVSVIKKGTQWSSVPWPDGSTGAMPDSLKTAQAAQRRFESRRPAHLQQFHDPDAGLRSVMEHYKPGSYELMMNSLVRPAGFTTHTAWDRAQKEKKWAEEEAKNYKPPNHYYNENYDPSIDPTLNPNKGMIDADACPKVPWDDILAQYSDLKIVAEAETNQDERTKDAIAITFQAFPPDSRRGEQAIAAINKLKGRLTSARYNPTITDGQVDKALPSAG